MINHDQYNSLMTIKELMALLQVKESYIRKMIFKKEIPTCNIGRLIRFKREEVAEWIEAKSSAKNKLKD